MGIDRSGRAGDWGGGGVEIDRRSGVGGREWR